MYHFEDDNIHFTDKLGVYTAFICAYTLYVKKDIRICLSSTTSMKGSQLLAWYRGPWQMYNHFALPIEIVLGDAYWAREFLM